MDAISLILTDLLILSLLVIMFALCTTIAQTLKPKEQVCMCKKPLGQRLANLKVLATKKEETMATIMILRDPETKKVTNVVKNPNTPEFLKEVGNWEYDIEFLTDEQWNALPFCKVCGCWEEICGGVHILNQPASEMLVHGD